MAWKFLEVDRRGALVGLALLVAAGCSPGGGGESAGQTESGGSSTVTATTGDTTTTTSASASASETASAGTGTDSMTSQPTTDPTTSASASGSTTDQTSESTTATSATTAETTGTTGTTGTTDTTGPIEESTGTTDPVDTTGGSSSTGPDCIPAAEVCNDLDDNCNGIVDDVDAGGDGICDCLNIAIWGNEGANPSAEFQTWLEAQGTQVDRIQIANMPVTQQMLDSYDIVILDWLTRTYTPQEAALIDGWVQNGGGLMSMTGHTNNNTVIDRPNSIIKPMGLSYNGSKGFFSGPVTQWAVHPITEGITSVTFLGGLYIDIVDDGIGMNTVVGTLPQGPVAVAQIRKAGKLFIFGDEWIEFDSEWKNIPQIKKFWVNILGWLSPQNFCTIPQ